MVAPAVRVLGCSLMPRPHPGSPRAQAARPRIGATGASDTRHSGTSCAGRPSLVPAPALRPPPLCRVLPPRGRASALTAVPVPRRGVDFVNSNVTPLALVSALLIGCAGGEAQSCSRTPQGRKRHELAPSGSSPPQSPLPLPPGGTSPPTVLLRQAGTWPRCPRQACSSSPACS